MPFVEQKAEVSRRKIITGKFLIASGAIGVSIGQGNLSVEGQKIGELGAGYESKVAREVSTELAQQSQEVVRQANVDLYNQAVTTVKSPEDTVKKLRQVRHDLNRSQIESAEDNVLKHKAYEDRKEQFLEPHRQSPVIDIASKTSLYGGGILLFIGGLKWIINRRIVRQEEQSRERSSHSSPQTT